MVGVVVPDSSPPHAHATVIIDTVLVEVLISFTCVVRCVW